MIPEKNAKRIFKVLSCVIYTIIRNYLCIDYVGYEKTKLSDLRLGVSGSYKNPGKKYDNVLGSAITDLLLNLLSCPVFLKNNESVIILKFTNRMFE